VSFADLLREHRRGLGLTQEELAERARLSARAISDLERGLKQAPRASTVRLLAEALALDEASATQLLAAAQGRERQLLPGSHQPSAGHNLRRELSSFIGRQQELAELQRLLETTPLLTVVGAGGIGKTRLALRLAAGVVSDYVGGVWLVELAALSDPRHVLQAVAAVLGVRIAPGRSQLEAVRAHLGDRRTLLVLDNCEHLVRACAELVEDLLGTCAGLRVLATSREPLGSAGELTWRVPSMAAPNPRALPPLESLVGLEAVRLFVERASAVRTFFRVTADNAAAVAEICWRLDGIPLALELAAARIASMSAHQVAERLEDRFRLLTQGGRTSPPRQQTLRATIDWSYDLLTEHERLLLDRVSVFAGGWTLEAAEVVCSGELIVATEIADLLAQLVARSLVLADSGPDEPVRYRLLETLRQYATERLVERGEVTLLRQRHLEHFVALAEEAQPHLAGGARQVAWMDRLVRERDNLRLAMRWCLDTADAEAGLQLGGALWWFWFLRDAPATDDGVDWCEAIVALSQGGGRTAIRARALDGAGALASQAGNVALAAALQHESVMIWRELGDQEQLARSLNVQGWSALQRHDWAVARPLLEEALLVARRHGDVVQEAIILNNLGRSYGEQGDEAAARDLHHLALAVFRERGDRHGVALSLSWLCHWGLAGDDHTAAIESGREALGLLRALGATRNLVWTCVDLGVLETPLDPKTAFALFEESLTLCLERGETRAVIWCLEAVAGLMLSSGRADQAVRLVGAASALEEANDYVPNRLQRELVAGWLASARAALGEPRASAAWAAGRALAREQAIAEALAADQHLRQSDRRQESTRPHADMLTPRERQVAALLAHGLTNRQIAEQLVVTERTAAHHVEHVLAKLGTPTRAAAAACAERAGLTSMSGAG
jgi:predicted ATPase/DNA-binding CsgD family transcriptional regulator/DNA-binding XRE family transcriptional regulator